MSHIKRDPFLDAEAVFDIFPGFAKFGGDLAVDIYERDDAVVAEMNLPGIDPANIHISVADDYLHISGTRAPLQESEEKKRYYKKEIQRGSFERDVRLPDNVNKASFTTQFKNGELIVVLPKKKRNRLSFS